MHIATNVLREVTRNLGAQTKKCFRSRWRIAVSTIAAHHVHAHAHAGVILGPNRSALQVPKGLLSRSQQVCSPGPNRSALQVPTGLLSGSQPVSSPGPNRCQQVSSPGPKTSYLQCLRLLVIARHHSQQLLCLLLCFSRLGVALHQLLLHAQCMTLQSVDHDIALCMCLYLWLNERETRGGGGSAGRGCWKGCWKGFQHWKGPLEGSARRGFQRCKGFQQRVPAGVPAQKGVPAWGSSRGSSSHTFPVCHRNHGKGGCRTCG